MTAKEIMTTDIITVKRDTSISEIAEILTTNDISGVPVVDDENALLGIVTGQDIVYQEIEPKFPAYVRKAEGAYVENYKDSFRKFVAENAEEIMSDEFHTVDENAEIKEIAEMMVDNSVKRVLVLKNGKLVGIISRRDIIKTLIS